MPSDSPFHAGEREAQARLGVRDIEGWARKVIRSYLPEQHRAFHTALPFLVAAARDLAGRPWATLLVGDEGFVTSPDARSLLIDARPVAGDALEGALTVGVDVGILGIEFETRRRNRMNARVKDEEAGGLLCAVDQTFGNCPQYIRERQWRRVDAVSAGAPTRSTKLADSQQVWISKADTFFIATGYRGEGDSPAYGMDASHRGGDAGFVSVENETRLSFPDYAGNNYFNTIGNLMVDPRVGLLFVDFQTGSLLQITGRAQVDWGSDRQRRVSIDVVEVVELPSAIPLRWNADADSVRSLRVIEKVQESDDVMSFVFEARDGGELPEFTAGQHLPIELRAAGEERVLRRTYSLSNGPDTTRYRISVKREPYGEASRFLHEGVDVGAIIDARRPAGDFVLDCSECPVVLISAGIGLTPMVSILNAVASETPERPVWFIHGARDGAHHPLASEVRALAKMRGGITVHVAYSRPRPDDRPGIDYDTEGRVDGRLLQAVLGRHVARPDAHYFVCGPQGFMTAVQEQLERQGVSERRIHIEAFGPH